MDNQKLGIFITELRKEKMFIRDRIDTHDFHFHDITDADDFEWMFDEFVTHLRNVDQTIPVSYTHLDVYKRQCLLFLKDIRLTWISPFLTLYYLSVPMYHYICLLYTS